MTKIPKYKLVNIIVAILSLITCILVYFSLVKKSYIFLFISSTLNGFVALSVFSFAYEMSLLLETRCGESLPISVMNTTAMVLSIIFTLGLTALLNNGGQKEVIITFVIFFGMLLSAFFMLLFLKINFIYGVAPSELETKEIELQSSARVTINPEECLVKPRNNKSKSLDYMKKMSTSSTIEK